MTPSQHPYSITIPIRRHTGSLTIPIRGAWSITIALRTPTEALLRCHQDGGVTEAALILIPGDPMADEAPYWHGWVPLGAGQPWHFRVRLDAAMSRALFDGNVKQPYVGEYAALTEDGKVAP